MNLSDVLVSIRCFGWYPVLQGTMHKFLRRSGLLKRRFPLIPWHDLDLRNHVTQNARDTDWRKRIDPAKFLITDGQEAYRKALQTMGMSADRVIAAADEIVQGRFKYFANRSVSLGLPIQWHRNPFSNAVWPADIHWCDIDYFSRDLGDIKDVWEISRFSWVFDLVRAYAVTQNTKYAEMFWNLFEDWMEHNQPNRGANWSSGQECALRVMAWCFALFAFLDDEATTDARLEKMVLALAVHGGRIEKFIAHAIRQKTNHAITEAAGLYTLGTLFPFFRRADAWKRLGREVLEREGVRQIYEDGSYVQHSMNYHRVMLHAYLWCLRLAKLNGERFSEALTERLVRATEFLYQVQDPVTGRVPNYGANDGALILPLDSCDYLDYRPVVQACWYQLKRERLFEEGPWNEDLFWLFGRESSKGAVGTRERRSSEFPAGGYYTLRGKSSWGMIRCHSYVDRIGHVDPLHLDLWADGINLLRDCGSYRYFAPEEPELEYYFKSVWAHNTVVVDGLSPIKLVSRFVWLPWLKCRIAEYQAGTGGGRFRGLYTLPSRRIEHQREVRLSEGDVWTVTDTIQGQGSHVFDLRWHLPMETILVESGDRWVTVKLPGGWYCRVDAPATLGAALLEATPDGGWESLHYAEKTPIKTLKVTVSNPLPLTITTTIGKGGDA